MGKSMDKTSSLQRKGENKSKSKDKSEGKTSLRNGVKSKKHPPCVALVLPCYNEEEALEHTIPTMLSLLSSLVKRGLARSSSYLYFCDDGSTDGTWGVLRASHRRYKGRVRALRLVCNVGREKALYAGLIKQVGACDAAISLDADLQDDISRIPSMLELFRAGDVDIVTAIRKNRQVDSFFKRLSAHLFYLCLRIFFRVRSENEADFRLMSERSLRALSLYRERKIYLRGLVPRMGFRQAKIYYERQARICGETKYTLGKMISLALDGITSQSTHPLRIIFFLGVAMFFGGIGLALYFLYQWKLGHTLQGWASLMLVFLFASSLQWLALGVVGEYLGKTFDEVRNNPRYLVDEEML